MCGESIQWILGQYGDIYVGRWTRLAGDSPCTQGRGERVVLVAVERRGVRAHLYVCRSQSRHAPCRNLRISVIFFFLCANLTSTCSRSTRGTERADDCLCPSDVPENVNVHPIEPFAESFSLVTCALKRRSRHALDSTPWPTPFVN